MFGGCPAGAVSVLSFDRRRDRFAVKIPVGAHHDAPVSPGLHLFDGRFVNRPYGITVFFASAVNVYRISNNFRCSGNRTALPPRVFAAKVWPDNSVPQGFAAPQSAQTIWLHLPRGCRRVASQLGRGWQSQPRGTRPLPGAGQRPAGAAPRRPPKINHNSNSPSSTTVSSSGGAAAARAVRTTSANCVPGF